ncbi:hypothetical protein LEMLEM_LOCUS1911 [Lemmus lemmus]
MLSCTRDIKTLPPFFTVAFLSSPLSVAKTQTAG